MGSEGSGSERDVGIGNHRGMFLAVLVLCELALWPERTILGRAGLSKWITHPIRSDSSINLMNVLWRSAKMLSP